MHKLTVSKDVSHCDALSSQTRVVWTHLSCFLLFKYKWTTMKVHLNCIKLKETEFQPRSSVRKFNHIERHFSHIPKSVSSKPQYTNSKFQNAFHPNRKFQITSHDHVSQSATSWPLLGGGATSPDFQEAIGRGIP